MADCEETLRELHAFLDGEMTPEELEHVRLHIDDCLDCLHVFDFHEELRIVIRTKCREQALPDGLAERIRACFGEAVAPEPDRSGAAGPGPTGPAAFA